MMMIEQNIMEIPRTEEKSNRTVRTVSIAQYTNTMSIYVELMNIYMISESIYMNIYKYPQVRENVQLPIYKYI